ncbi:hypothetical protein BOX37_07330 [Nocardia mangyaensis]|uniref:Uncharacterized protein n=1 Tax=Nocardia mangyaensis TaxID=2213200 RepID=A0A1J0VP71_9NOCA|nr:hypothetical protein [Nocardia mangyaensis]APE33813.1 hypothetical protein BOX37_07330 [Nocardia mangyaensis]
MHPILRKALMIAIALLLGIIVGIVNGLLTHFGGGPITETIRDGGIGFAGTSAFVLVVMACLGAL